MHPAPAASHPLGARRAQFILIGALSAAGAAVLTAWWVSGAASPPALAVALGVWLIALGWSLAGVRRAPAGRLFWDGARWWIDRPAGAAETPAPVIVMDLQAVMLLHSPAVRPAWLWLARADDPASWADLRRALRAARPGGGDAIAGGSARQPDPGRQPA